MEKIFMCLCLIVVIIFNSKDVYALEGIVYYENEKGYIVSEKEFDIINQYYRDDYFYTMNEKEYFWIKSLDVDNSDVEVKTNEFNYSMRSAIHTTNYKKLTILKSCNSFCFISVRLEWLRNPVVRSYDVIGARLYGTELISDDIETNITYGDLEEQFYNLRLLSNGFGVSVKLPSTTETIVVEQSFRVTNNNGGKVFASYQHATSSVSLSTSQLYNISSNGLGGVFNFYGNASETYDAMGGVYIDL